MLSKKMAVSLTSLITILALAAMPALVQAFDVKFDAHDISHAGDIQIERAEEVEVYVTFGKVVTLEDIKSVFPDNAKGHGRVDILNYYGAVIDTDGNTVSVMKREYDDRLTAEENRQLEGKSYTLTITLTSDQGGDPDASLEDLDKNEHAYRLRLFLPAEALTEADRNAGAKSAKGFHDKIYLVNPEPQETMPMPISIELQPGVLIPDSGFTGESFDIILTLSEQPKENKLTMADHFAVDKGTAADAVYWDAIAPSMVGEDADMAATGRDRMWHRYVVTITPAAEDANLVFKLKKFGDQEIYIYDDSDIAGLGPNEWKPPVSELDRMEGVDKLTVKIKKKVDPIKTAGLEVVIPNETRIPASGWTVFATNNDGSGITDNPGNDKDEPKATERTPAQLKYNLVELSGLPNLETFLANGGTIDLVGSGDIYISEVMWGSDASLDPNNNSQWIEIANSGSSLLTGDKTHKLVFYGPNEVPRDMSEVADRIGTVGAGGYWSIAGKGQSGRSGTGEKAADGVAVVPTQALISMQRVMGADGMAADGTMASSWAASTPPALNFDATSVGARVGTPGAAPVMYPPAPPEPEPVPEPVVVPVAGASEIMITEIMVDTSHGRLPQWIELTNVSGAEVSLAGWSLRVINAADDPDVIGSTVDIDLSGNMLGVGGGEDLGGTKGKSLLLVGGNARSSANLSGSDRVVDISSQVGERGRYAFISMAFMAALIPPQKTGVLTYGDTAGNLHDGHADWELPMSENGRSSLIRREMLESGMATMGTDANGWVLASGTSLVSGPATWYGSDEDAGTPGYDAGGPLPVELSHFRPARNKTTGAVVITWATQSELNNAGFFIKRSQQPNGEFKVINATMVPGAGTTSEKQFYTYTDTTAQPNVVYYYQIEDVSLDGNRQTLTRGVRLKGHIGAAGKLTTTWGEIKSSNE